jgi:hypothetical protein
MLATLVVIAAVALSACSSNPTSSEGTSVGGGGSSTASAAPTATAAPSQGTLAVDLVFSGTLSLTAKGAAGQCDLGHSVADGSIVFGFHATDADYPGLEDGIYLNEDLGTHRLNEKWLSSVAPSVGSLPEGSVTFSSDHNSVTIDADLPGGIEHTEHLIGTISCP